MGPLEGVVINLTLESGDIPTFPPQGKTATTNDNGYYEFEVPGYWEVEIPTRAADLSPHGGDRPCRLDAAQPGLAPRDASSYIIENVAPGSEDNDFYNEKLVPNKKISGYK